MLDHATRVAVLTLKDRGQGIRQIARALRISRGAVRKVPPGERPMCRTSRGPGAEPHKEEIVELLVQCKGNLVRARGASGPGRVALASSAHRLLPPALDRP